MTVDEDLKKLFAEKYGSVSQARTEALSARNTIDSFKTLVDKLPQKDRGSRYFEELTRRLTEASNGLTLILDGPLRA